MPRLPELWASTRSARTAPETAWIFSGGGISLYEPEPGYQIGLPIPNTGGFRGFPDVALNADPSPGQAVYDTTGVAGQKGWFDTSGTSIGSPEWAGIIALINEGLETHLTSYDLISRLYGAAAPNVYNSNYRDITSGSNGTCGAVCQARPGYDFVTGLGVPRADHLVPFLTGKAR